MDKNWTVEKVDNNGNTLAIVAQGLTYEEADDTRNDFVLANNDEDICYFIGYVRQY